MLQAPGRTLRCVLRCLRRPSALSAPTLMTAASPRPRLRPKPPLVAVIGTTGVGKTDLGVELALALRSRAPPGSTFPPLQRDADDSPRGPEAAHVINHDSMQCYRGLDTITNKATEDEMRGVPHHLMGFLEPGEEWSVNDFLRDALAKVSGHKPPEQVV